MKINDQYVRTLTKKSLSVNGIETAVYFDPQDTSKKTALFVHGIGGNHRGLAVLATKLKRYNHIFVDLPGHGESELPTWSDYHLLEKWFQALLKELKRAGITVDIVIAHSFGCGVAANTKKYMPDVKLIMINPVPTPSSFYVRYFMTLKGFQKAIIPIYRWELFGFFRGMFIIRRYSKESIKAVWWLSKIDASSQEQLRYQLKLSENAIMKSKLFYHYHNFEKPDVVICGKNDTLAREHKKNQIAKALGSTPHMVRGGHMLPIENTSNVVRYIPTD